MAFLLVKEVEKRRHKIAKWHQLQLVRGGSAFKDGESAEESAA
jgi:hypothetical protein